ncbi:helix-turn-helix transcriptional regulator [Pseudonocardia lacus]|uniref:helix-turn-helix transcriptional regulator n=1 Tax=Pseudonocardia lacus TaxID=2835865 RepID=UPI001BDD6029|nr:AraC family transcriptional regulator [Pseudonocardia lacus]
MRTARLPGAPGHPPTYALAPAPGELPVAVWGITHGVERGPRLDQHAHDFAIVTYIETGGRLHNGGREVEVRSGDVLVIAPGDVMGPFELPISLSGWGVSFTPDALGPDVPGSYLAWRTHPLLFPFVRGGATGARRLSVPVADRPEWAARVRALSRELDERPDGYREAALAHLVLLLVGVSRLAADVVGALRGNAEPLLAEVFAVIEERYPQPLSLRDVARAVNITPGHLTSTVRRRTGRTVQEWITERRMVQARRLLAATTLPVGEVGRLVGYPHPGYFARVFGRVNGVSPARWRDAGR